jgi:hypothetical protein
MNHGCTFSFDIVDPQGEFGGIPNAPFIYGKMPDSLYLFFFRFSVSHQHMMIII